MTNFEVFKEEKNPEYTVFLKLAQSNGVPTVIAVDKNGEFIKFVLSFREDSIQICGLMSKELGLKTVHVPEEMKVEED